MVSVVYIIMNIENKIDICRIRSGYFLVVAMFSFLADKNIS